MNSAKTFAVLFIFFGYVLAGDIPRPRVGLPGQPIKAVYINGFYNLNAPNQSVLDAVSAGFNVIILSYYTSNGVPLDIAARWAALDDETKRYTVNVAHSKGAVVMASFGGPMDYPWDYNPSFLGKQIAAWVLSQHLDGVDFDLEFLSHGFIVSNMTGPQTVNWISTITQVTSQALGNSSIISHSPFASLFGPIGATDTWVGITGGYTGVEKQAGNYTTFYNIRYYNLGLTCYNDFEGIFWESGQECPGFPNTSVAEISAAGVPLSKIVVGKPITPQDATSGWISANDLYFDFVIAQFKVGWTTGVMGWKWNDPATCKNWIQTLYNGPITTTTSTTSNHTTSSSLTSSTTYAPNTTTITTSTSTTGNYTSSLTSTTYHPNITTVTSSSTSSGTSTSGIITSTTSMSTSTLTTSVSTTGSSCSGRATGWYCVGKTEYEFCPIGQIDICPPGKTCVQIEPLAISCQ